MNRRLIRTIFIALALGLVSGMGAAQPRNVILFIGDGMGPEQVEAGRLLNGDLLSFEDFPHQGEVTTYSATAGVVTDSAAAATAIATGQKVNNGVISLALPGDGGELMTILEWSQLAGKSTGLVTTVYITHATPAAFGAHEPLRTNYKQIGEDYFNQSRPNLLFGGAYYVQDLFAADYGYTIVQTRQALELLDTESADMISGQFGDASDGVPYESAGEAAFQDLPHLSEMTAKALRILDNNPAGFFLMVEGGKIDWACHDNNYTNMVHEVLEFSNAVAEAELWAANRTDTLIIVTADHETGGLTVEGENVSWTTAGHTPTNVPIYAWGPNSALVSGILDNTDIIDIMTAVPHQATDPLPPSGADGQELLLTLSWTADAAANSFDVYLGTDMADVANADPNSEYHLGYTTDTTFPSPELMPNTTYYWCVDTRDADGNLLARGAVWSFTTFAELTVQAGAIWRYDDTATDLFTAWREPDYDDSLWPSGPAQLGFGDDDESTELTSGARCYYFRHAFHVADPSAYTALELQLLRDDGAVVYLNGIEVVRSNMPDGTITYSSLAPVGIPTEDDSTWYTYPIMDTSPLVPGRNVIAVEVHQWSDGSSDASFDLALLPAQNNTPGAPTGLTATAGDGSVTLDWSDNNEPEGDLDGYRVYRGTESGAHTLLDTVYQSTFTDSAVENGTTYYYVVSAIDMAGQESDPSAEVEATPAAPSPDAFVLQEPLVTYGAVSGSAVDALRTANDGLVQTIMEAPNGQAGASSLFVEYRLYTPADPSQIIALRLLTALTWVDDDADDYIHIEILRDDGVWEDITTEALGGFWAPAFPADYVDDAGYITIQFSDSGAVKKESKGTLTIDQLYAQVEAGEVAPDETPPEITNVRDDGVTYTAASIVWDTDEPSDSVVLYGQSSTSLTSSETDTSLATSHAVTLAGLAPDTTYYYTVSSTDASGNTSESAIYSFTTPAMPDLRPIYVSDLDMEIVPNRNKATAEVTATVEDGDGAVEGATVVGDWYFRDALVLSGASGETNTDGITVIASPEKPIKSGDVFQFVVTDVVKADCLYEAGPDDNISSDPIP